MGVTGYLALYTTLLGWEQYNNLWNIMVTTGLVYLPFFGIVVGSCLGPFTSMGAKDAAVIATRRMGIGIVSALFIIALAGTPTVFLSPTVLHYEPLCQPQAPSSTPGNSGTTYDNAFAIPTGVKVPILWYIVLALSNGVTHAANVGLSCAPLDYRQLHETLNLTKITDPNLKQETVDFYNQCFVPAKSRYLGDALTPTQQSMLKTYLTKYGKDDVSSLGSQVFLNVPGFYESFHAQQPISGFTFSMTRDAIPGQVTNHSVWGEPACTDWWSDPQNGLQTRVLAVLPSNVMHAIQQEGDNTHQIMAQAAAIKTLIKVSFDQSFEDQARGYESLENNMKGDFISRWIGGPIGVEMEGLSFFPKLHLLINALSVIQASLLFALYVFLAIALPFSSFRAGFCITAAMMLFSLTFCSFIWHLVAWFDNQLIYALFPKQMNMDTLTAVLLGDPANAPNIKFVNMIIGSLYIVLPLVWMTVMSWASVRMGIGMIGMMGSMSAAADSAGHQAASAAKTAASKAM